MFLPLPVPVRDHHNGYVISIRARDRFSHQPVLDKRKRVLDGGIHTYIDRVISSCIIISQPPIVLAAFSRRLLTTANIWALMWAAGSVVEYFGQPTNFSSTMENDEFDPAIGTKPLGCRRTSSPDRSFYFFNSHFFFFCFSLEISKIGI